MSSAAASDRKSKSSPKPVGAERVESDWSEGFVSIRQSDYQTCAACGLAGNITAHRDADIIVYAPLQVMCHERCVTNFYKALLKRAEEIVHKSFMLLLPVNHQTEVRRMAHTLVRDLKAWDGIGIGVYSFSNPALPFSVLIPRGKKVRLPDRLFRRTNGNPFSSPMDWWSTGRFVFRVVWDPQVLSFPDMERLVSNGMQQFASRWPQICNPTSVAASTSASASANTTASGVIPKSTILEIRLIQTLNSKEVFIVVEAAAEDVGDQQLYLPSSVSNPAGGGPYVQRRRWDDVLAEIATQLLESLQRKCNANLITTCGQKIEFAQCTMKVKAQMHVDRSILGIGVQFAAKGTPERLVITSANDPKEADAWGLPRKEDFICHKPEPVGYPFDLYPSFPNQLNKWFSASEFDPCGQLWPLAMPKIRPPADTLGSLPSMSAFASNTIPQTEVSGPNS